MPKYDNFVNTVATLRNPTDLIYLGSLFPVNDHPDYAVHGTPPFVKEEGFLSHIASGWAPFMYEAVIAAGLAACSASQEHLDFTGQEHFAHIKNTTFSGFSGSVVFDQETGTRIPSSAMYKVTNYVAEEEVDKETGEAVVRFQPVITDLFAQGNWSQRIDFIFNDGTPKLPADLAAPSQAVDGKEEELRVGLLIGVPITFVAILGLIVFLFYENKRKKNDAVWQVAREELDFGSPPEIIGRGSFGLILLAEYRGTQVAVKRVIPPRAEKKDKGTDNVKGDGTGISSGTHSGISGDSSGLSGGTSSYGSNNSNNDKNASLPSKIGSMSLSRSHSMNSGLSSSVRMTSTLRGNDNIMFGNPANWAMASAMSGAISGVGTFLTGARGRRNLATGQNEANVWRQLKQEFISEMRYLSKLRHPSITTVMGAVTVGERK